MMIFALMYVTGYFRPSGLLRMRRGDLVPPAKHVLQNWAVLIAPEEETVPTTTNNCNDSVEMDSPLVEWLAPFYEEIHVAVSTDCARAFTYSQYVMSLKAAAAELHLTNVVPHQRRHSGPSIDLGNRTRNLEQVQKRGRWAAASTMVRYERYCRFSKDWGRLTEKQKSLFTDCAEALVDIATSAPHQCRISRL